MRKRVHPLAASGAEPSSEISTGRRDFLRRGATTVVLGAGVALALNRRAFAASYDTVCGQCNKHCCSPCTADGDISRCAQTRFKACSVCGHPSSGHYQSRN